MASKGQTIRICETGAWNEVGRESKFANRPAGATSRTGGVLEVIAAARSCHGSWNQTTSHEAKSLSH